MWKLVVDGCIGVFVVCRLSVMYDYSLILGFVFARKVKRPRCILQIVLPSLFFVVFILECK